jgi:hypothetical protein
MRSGVERPGEALPAGRPCRGYRHQAGLHAVILDAADHDAWLDAQRWGSAELLRPCPAAWLEAVPVSTRVNSPRNDDAALLEPEGEPLAAQGTLV